MGVSRDICEGPTAMGVTIRGRSGAARIGVEGMIHWSLRRLGVLSQAMASNDEKTLPRRYEEKILTSVQALPRKRLRRGIWEQVILLGNPTQELPQKIIQFCD